MLTFFTLEARCDKHITMKICSNEIIYFFQLDPSTTPLIMIMTYKFDFCKPSPPSLYHCPLKGFDLKNSGHWPDWPKRTHIKSWSWVKAKEISKFDLGPPPPPPPTYIP